MTPTPYLFFNGQCRDAITRYVEIFGGEIENLMPASDLPPEYPVPENRKDWVMHAQVRLGGGVLMASDNIQANSAAMDGCSVMMSLADAAAAQAAFEKLAEDGEITMPFTPTFWSAGFGTVIDRFGVRWMIGTDQPPQS